MKKIKVGFIGCGSFANMVHYPSLTEMDDVEIVAICDIDQERLNNTGKKYNIDKRYTDYKKMVEENELDVVYIIMPPHHLYDIVIEILKRKLNVFIEKPPGINLFQIKNMANFAIKNNCKTMVGFNRRFIPLLRKVKEIVEKKGPIIQVVSTFYKNMYPDFLYYNGVIDILTCDAIHSVDALRWLCGEVKNLKSVIKSYYSDIPNAFNAIIEFENGATGILLTNWTVGKRIHTFELHSLGISAFVDCNDKALIYKDNNEKPEIISAYDVAKSDQLYKFYGYYDENRYFIDCLRENKESECNFVDAIKTMELIEKIYKNNISS
ncbi:MAG: Gfo/Idh/MocA family oxidoreductase [Candidatus Omnitrophica bacterium]|nr:Gfo/Idh/MocA family oxidoreductase [Candidatus Omnitrophota bacterium]